MGTSTAKSFVEERASTDEMIFKSALKKMYGLNSEQMLSYWPTVQNTSEIIKPDGTIALNQEDIRLVMGDPLRTPSGLLEFKEDTPEENFPIKISLESIKYDAESFLAAIDSDFEEYSVANIPTMGPGFDLPSVNVLDVPPGEEEETETFVVDWREDPAAEEEEAVPKTATEVHGSDVKLLTAINSAGALTGISGKIYMIFKGIRYEFPSKLNGEREVPDAPGAEDGEQVLPPYAKNKKIVGLTNTISGRNMEVFMKDRGLSYDDVDIVPNAVIRKITSANTFFSQEQYARLVDDIKFGSADTSGQVYNSNSFKYNGIQYEPGDLIDIRDGGRLKDQSKRWTEYHPHETKKPANKALTYKPTVQERSAKGYEGKVVRGYQDGISNRMLANLDTGRGALTDYFMVIRGRWTEMYPWSEVTSYQGNPPSKIPNLQASNGRPFWNDKKREGSLVDPYPNNSYMVMNWDHMRYIAPGLSIQTIDIDAFISTLGSTYVGNSWSQWVGNFRPATNYGGTSFPYAKDSSAPEQQVHYYRDGRFVWPYDAPSAPLTIKANMTLKKSKNGHRGFGIYLEIQDAAGNRVKIKEQKGRKKKNTTSTIPTMSMTNVILNKGDTIHARASQDSSKKRLTFTKVQLIVNDIRLTDWKGTKELDRELLTTYGTIGEKGGMVAEKKMQGSSWRRYIEDGDFYDQPHLTEYNELFSEKVSSTIKKTV